MTPPRRRRGRWERNAEFWIRIIRKRLDPFRSQLTDAEVLRAIGPCAGAAVLDAGCGEGYMARALTERGATVVGLDRSARLLRAAGEMRAGNDQEPVFALGDLAALPFRDEQLDVVLCNHSLNDLRFLRRPFQEFARVLRPGGRLVVLMLHPCFYGGRDDRGNREEAPVGRYFSLRRVEQRFSVSGEISPAPTVIWVRPLESYFALLADAGFHVSVLREPHPSKARLERDPWWRATFTRPLFLLLSAVKQPAEVPGNRFE
jgi:SAM-dependent methyltransferase